MLKGYLVFKHSAVTTALPKYYNCDCSCVSSELQHNEFEECLKCRPSAAVETLYIESR